MSIWCSWPHIGTDPTVMYDVGDGLYEVDLDGGTEGRTPVKQVAERGNVLSYADGFSNHYPDLTGSHERPAVIALAHAAPWCVTGHDQGGDGYACTGCGEYHMDEFGSWLRIEVAAPEALNFWVKDDSKPTVESEGATVLLDEEAVRSLRDDLNVWLERERVYPLPTHRPEAGTGEGVSG